MPHLTGRLILCTFTLAAITTAAPSLSLPTTDAMVTPHSSPLLIKDVHYGDDSGLDIRCAADELIQIESETLAYSAGKFILVGA